jgi:hypothetical protein
MTRRTPLAVYNGTLGLGEIEDHGPGDVRAWLGIGAGRTAIGTFDDRKTAMRAISTAAKEAGR